MFSKIAKKFYFLNRSFLFILEEKFNRKNQIYRIILFMFIGSIAEMVVIGSIIPLISFIIDVDNFYDLKIFILFLKYFDIGDPKIVTLLIALNFVLLVLLAGVFRFYTLKKIHKLSSSLISQFSKIAFDEILHKSLLTHLNTNSSEYIKTMIAHTQTFINNGFLPYLNIINSLLISVPILILLIYISPIITISIFLFIVLIYFFIISNSNKLLKKLGNEINDTRTLSIKTIQESLGSIKDIKLSSAYEYHIQDYEINAKKLFSAIETSKFYAASPRIIIETFCIVFFVLIVFFIQFFTSSINIFLPILIMIIFSFFRLLPLANLFYSSCIILKTYNQEIEDFISIVNYSDQREFLGDEEIEFNRNILIKGLNFRYSIEDNYSLKDVNLQINKGEIVGIFGRTGSGKSTLINYLIGFFPIQKKTLFIDGVELNKNNLRAWQDKIALVSQFIYLTDKSVQENIAFGIEKKSINQDRLIEVSKVCLIYDLIQSWKNKFESNLGEDALKVSGGQRQRIAIARALYHKKSVLILDEATSALDVETEEKILKNIKNLTYSPTIIVISHRINLIKDCNKIFEINNGNIKSIN